MKLPRIEYKEGTTVTTGNHALSKGDCIKIMDVKYEITAVGGSNLTIRPYRWYHRIITKLKGIFRVR